MFKHVTLWWTVQIQTTQEQSAELVRQEVPVNMARSKITLERKSMGFLVRESVD